MFTTLIEIRTNWNRNKRVIPSLLKIGDIDQLIFQYTQKTPLEKKAITHFVLFEILPALIDGYLHCTIKNW